MVKHLTAQLGLVDAPQSRGVRRHRRNDLPPFKAAAKLAPDLALAAELDESAVRHMRTGR
ncbi:hypothetical protein ACH4FA_33995 [Streptomyces sp. NPDC017966]|uniref:hypothetical protein n=1 Tax=Streptomyces sp. NPDC017966 TaxID=3365023 RepID=UPI0037BBA8BE